MGRLRDALYVVAFTVAAVAGSATAADHVALAWPAAGVAALWLFGARGVDRVAAAVGVAAIATTVPVLTGADPVTAAVLAVGTVAGAAAAAVLLRRLWSGDPLSLATVADGVRVAVVASAAGIAAAVTTVLAAPVLPGGADAVLVVLVLVRSALGCLVVVVPALAIHTWGRRADERPRTLLLLGDLAITAATYGTVFVADDNLSLGFAVLPVTLWFALRAGVLRTALHALAVAVLATALTRGGHGPFEDRSATAESLLVQGFVVVVILAGLGLALARAEQARATAAAQAAADRLNAIADAAPVANLTVRVGDGDAVIVRANPAAAQLLDTPVDGLAGATWTAFVDPVDRARVRAELAALTADGAHGRTAFEVLHRLPSGDVRWTEVSAADARAVGDGDGATYVTVQMLDVTARRAAEHRLAHLALHDELTGLPNRLLLMDRLDQALAESRRTGRGVAVVFFDLDLFKRVNDTLGHAAGDELLVAVAGRLADAARESDTVARLGGDEFVACCPGVDGEEEGRALAERLLRLAGRPVHVQGHEVRVGLSAGVTVSGPTSSASELLRESDDALYAAKHAGRGRVESYSDRVAAHVQRHVEVGEALDRALERDELVLHYQRIVDLRTGQVRALEALVRWDHPTRGLLLPAEWLDVAESSDVMVPLGRWVLREACAEAVRQARAGRPVSMHVNVAARELRDPGMAAATRTVLAETGLDPERLVLELTETRLLEVHQSLLADLEDLRSLGVRIAADDFGTGYSTLRQLVDLPIDMVKIDRGFVSGVADEPRATAVVHGIVGMAQSIGMTLVAEGVETPGQAQALEDAGCYLAQGFLWHCPAPAAELCVA